MDQRVGKQSVEFSKSPRITASASVAGKKEGEGPLGKLFDLVCQDDKFGEDSWEKSECEMQKEALQLVMKKRKKGDINVRYLFGGDLLGQLMATSFGIESFHIPFLGLYGACSTCSEALMLAAMTVSGGYAKAAAVVTSSHFASAEKQFRFPLAYGNQRPLTSTWTVTGSGAFIVSEDLEGVKITGATAGRILDYGIKDSMNMGACMAPAAADTIFQHFKDFHRDPEDYDRIITGDLGYVGKEILTDLLWQRGYSIKERHMDCGIEIFDRNTQDTHSGGSGCGCSAVVLSAMIIPKILKGDWKRVLFIPTGALLSPVSFNQGLSIPGIAHAIVLES